MPITNPYDRMKYRTLGYDPDEVDLVTVADPEPARQSTPLPPPDTTTWYGTLAREAARNFPSVVAGAKVGMKVGEMVPGNPLIKGIAGLGSGLAAGIGTRYLQNQAIDKLAPTGLKEAYQKSEEEDTTQHPQAAALGDVLSNGLIQRPSLGVVGALKNLVTGQAGMQDAGQLVSSGLGAGIPAAQTYLHNPNATAKDYLIDALGGLFTGKSTWLGNKLGVGGDHIGGSKVDATGGEPPQVLTPEEQIPQAVKQLPAPPERLQLNDAEQQPTIKQLPEKTDAVAIKPIEQIKQALTPEVISNQVGEPLPPIEQLPRARVNVVSPLPEPSPEQVPSNVPIDEASTSPPKSILQKASDNTIGTFRPEIDKIEAIGTPEAKTLAQAMRDQYEQHSTLRGSLVNNVQQKLRKLTGLDSVPKAVLTQPGNYLKQNTSEMANVVKSFFHKQDTGQDLPLSPKEQAIKSTVQDYYSNVRQQQLTRPGLSQGVVGENPDYLSNIPKRSVIKTVTQDPTSAPSQTLQRDFVNYHVAKGATPQEAKAMLQDTMDTYSGKHPANTAGHYGPIDERAGMGLPPSWREDNLLTILSHYGDRVAKRFAYHDTFETKPVVIAAAKLYAPNDSVKFVMRDITGNRSPDNPTFMAMSGVARAFELGPLTGERDAMSAFTLGSQHHESPIQTARATFSALTHIKQSFADAWSTGRIRHNLSSLEADLGVEDFTTVLRRTRDVASDLFTRNYFDQVGRAVNMGQGEWVARDFHQDYLKGKLSKQGKAWFENFGRGINWQQPELSHQDTMRMAARYVDSVQGTYDPRGLPKNVMEGGLSPLLSLNRWGIEKSNNFIKYTIKPAMEGNFRPLINSTLSGLLGGAAINYVTSAMTGHKQRTPTLSELKAQPSWGGAFYAFAGLADASSHVGMMGSLVKSIMDLTYGKQRPQEINNILISAGGKAAENAGSFIQSWQEDGPSPQLLAQWINQTLIDNVQAYRMVMNHVNQAETDKSNKMRDLQVFDTLAGKDQKDLRNSYTPVIDDGKMKRFRETTDLSEAANLLPQLADKAKARAEGDPEKLMSEVDKIKHLSYDTFPNPTEDKTAISAAQYYSYLVKAYGKAEADARIKDWASHQLLNQAKVEKLKEH